MKCYSGWYVVAGAFVVLFVVFGCAYSFGTFFEGLQHEFAASRASVSLAFSLASLLYFLLGAITGVIADRIGARRIAGLGMLALAVGLLQTSRADTLTQVYLSYGLGVGLGVGCVYVPAVSLVQRWFTRRRGLASGFAVTGIGAGSLVVPLIAAALIRGFGWRDAFQLMAFAALAAGLLGTALLLPEPPSGGAHAARPGAPQGAGAAWERSIRLGEAMRSRPFMHIYLAQFFGTFGMAITFVHVIPYALDGGLEMRIAVLSLGVIGIGSTVGRFILGGVADRFGRQVTMSQLFFLLGLGYLFWLLPVNLWTVGVFSLLFGMCYGGFVAILPPVIADYFMGPSLAGIIGVEYTGAAFGMFLGPLIAGWAFDLQGSYGLPMLGCAIFSVLAGISILTTPPAAEWRLRAISGLERAAGGNAAGADL